MEYKQLVRNNPTDENLTKDSSIWLASRIMPGKGNKLISFPHFLVINNAGARTCLNSDLMINGMIGMADNETFSTISAASLVWKGCWTVNNQTVIGHCTNAKGLVSPFNAFNVGYRYKRGWRPSKNVN
jgi:hypothetical protein